MFITSGNLRVKKKLSSSLNKSTVGVWFVHHKYNYRLNLMTHGQLIIKITISKKRSNQHWHQHNITLKCYLHVLTFLSSFFIQTRSRDFNLKKSATLNKYALNKGSTEVYNCGVTKNLKRGVGLHRRKMIHSTLETQKLCFTCSYA